jgi:S1-C subfamily serine protease
VAAAVSPSVVKITSVSGQQEAVGSGDVLTSNGYIVTNDHVVQGYSSYTVTLTSGRTYTATLVGQDAQDDLAVLKISATGLKPVSFADSSKAQVGQFAVAVGYPLGLSETSTYGIVSALNRAVSEAPSGPAGELAGLVQTSAQLNPGNSGGALVNLQGQLIGVPTLSATDSETGSAANGIGYAIPSNRVAYVAEQLIQYGKLTTSAQGFLGIQGADVTPQVAAAYSLSVDSGVLVTGFASDAAGASPAEQAGLKSGDIITAVNGQTVTNSDDLSEDALSRLPGTKITLTILRSGAQQNITVTLGERPTN